MFAKYNSLVALACFSIFSSSLARPYNRTCEYPSNAYITSVFTLLTDGSADAFFSHIADSVSWIVMGTSPVAGHYSSKQAFLDNVIIRLEHIEEPTTTEALMRVTGGCDEPWSVQELLTNTTMKNGMPFLNQESWSTRWNRQGQIVEIQSYVDSELISRVIMQNEPDTDANFQMERS